MKWQIPAALLGLLVHLSQADLCSQSNTGSSFSAVFNTYQSIGACSSTCSGYAFAVLQGNQCWCSNYQPADTVDLSKCSAACPGYGPESCSSAQEGTYRYVQIGKSSGTASAPATTSSASQSSIEKSSSSKSHSPATSSATTSVSYTVSVMISKSVVFESLASGNQSAQIKTVYITATTSFGATPTSSPTALSSTTSLSDQSISSSTSSTSSTSSSFFDDKAKVAGVFTVVALLIVGLFAALGFFCYRRRKRALHGTAVDDEGLSDATLSPHTTAAGWEKNATASDGTGLKANGSRGSSLYALMGGASAAAAASKRMKSRRSPNMRGGGGSSGDEGSVKRPERSASNATMIVDQRLDPSGLGYLMRFEDEGEDELSSADRASLRDEEDYGRRVWRVTNRGDEDGRSLSSIED